MTIGAEDLWARYGGPDGVAEAWIEGRLGRLEARYADEIVSKTCLLAAEIRVRLRREREAKTDA